MKTKKQGISNWLLKNNHLTAVRKKLQDLLAKRKFVIMNYPENDGGEVLELVRKIKSENETLLLYNEAHQLFTAVRTTEKVDGDIAEVGSYRGGSAKIICEAKKEKVLHLFDTFEGLPELSSLDDHKQFHKGQFIATFDFVRNYLSKYKNVLLYRGLFPATSGPVANKRFSFVHLDVDLYKGTLDSLAFFYPRMNRGGIIMSHDYSSSVGVQQAFKEFFADKPEPIIEMSGTHCLVVKAG